jgi:hypothetical protein
MAPRGVAGDAACVRDRHRAAWHAAFDRLQDERAMTQSREEALAFVESARGVKPHGSAITFRAYKPGRREQVRIRPCCRGVSTDCPSHIAQR